MKFLLILAPLALLAGCSNQNSSEAPSVVSTQNVTTPAPMENNQPQKPVRGFVRALHAVPGAGTVSLSTDGQKIASVNYGDATPFSTVSAQNVKISAFGGDGQKIAGPMPLALYGGEDVSVLITGIPGDVVLLPWKHKNYGPEKGKSKIAFVHSAKALPAMEIRIDGQSFRREVKFGIATDYTTLAPGKHQIQVLYDKSLAPTIVKVEQPTIVTQDEGGNVLAVEQPTPLQTVVPRKEIVTLTTEENLGAGKVYSLAVFQGAGQQPKVRLMEDKFAAEIAGG